MEQSHSSTDWLYLIDKPTFRVQNKKILQVNPAAQQLLIEAGTDVTTLLQTGAQEYAAFSGKSLYLTLRCADAIYGATVTRIEGYDVFQLNPSSAQAGIEAMALSARELRKPLTNVLNATEAMSAKDAVSGTPVLSEYAAQINRSLFQLLRLVENMSDVRRFTLDTPRLETRNITSVFGEILEYAQTLVTQAGFTLRFANLNCAIYTLADQQMLERAIFNLISNAMKFSAPGSTITAALTRSGNMLYFTVEDSGNGVSPNLRGNIFSRYQREPSVEDSRLGIGLGMPLIASVATAHGGTVLMEHAQGQGMRITMTISLRQRTQTTMRTTIQKVDYDGGWDHGLMELSEVLPVSAYKS